MVATFWFVRHGQTPYNERGQIQGYLPIELSEKGKAQAQALAEELKTVPFSVCYSSDLVRAKQTANIIAQKCALSVTQDLRLRERSRGAWAGKYETEFKAAPESDKQDQESDASMVERLFRFMNDVGPKHVGETVLVVTHERVICNIAIQLLSLSCQADEMAIKNTGHLKCIYSDSKWYVLAEKEITYPVGCGRAIS